MRTTLRIFSAAILAAGIASLVGGGLAAAGVLSPTELETEMRANDALREHVRDRGYPDLAQRWDVDATWPWQSYIIRLFYLKPRTEIAFSRAVVFSRPRVGLVRYTRPMSDELAAEVGRFLATPPGPEGTALGAGEGLVQGGPAERAEAAARRAEVAADMTELGAAAAEQAARRVDAVAMKAERSFK